ncbi:hypothetical protein AVEN_47620-1 [Araneus ventricosus]|uniref:Uncharacterized protein n=1 Tax=Araneus ventricosus TaxID=182803 RepID=A0A4Y2QPD8_ARAVE|nr:hypothetical protein AVEN_47620-1 [Araneus ventricosus]
MKEVVHFQINELIDALRERELTLRIEIQREYFAQMDKIDHDITVNCVNKILKRSDENKYVSLPLKL